MTRRFCNTSRTSLDLPGNLLIVIADLAADATPYRRNPWLTARAPSAPPPAAPHPIPPPGKPRSRTLTGVVVGVVIICALYFGSDGPIPITLAILLCFVLSPLMGLLRRLLLPRVVAALLAVLIAISIIIVLGGIIGAQIAGLVGQAPQDETTIENKATSLQTLYRHKSHQPP